MICDCLLCDLDLKDAFAKVLLTAAALENSTPTVSFGFSSVYSLRPEPLGFFPVPVLGSLLICPFALFASCALVLAELLHSKSFRIRAILRSLTSL